MIENTILIIGWKSKNSAIISQNLCNTNKFGENLKKWRT